jgi:carbon monoxide dehydrogenase subunit G
MAMEFSGQYSIPAPRRQVWEALNDPAVLQACIPGCRQLEKISETEFVATVVSKVGPISATFRGNVVLSDLDPPNGYTLTGRGQGGAAGFARMSAAVTLRPDGEGTVLGYLASAEIGGKLASVGSRLVQTVAGKNADDFFAAFARRLGGTGAEEPAPLPRLRRPCRRSGRARHRQARRKRPAPVVSPHWSRPGWWSLFHSSALHWAIAWPG